MPELLDKTNLLTLSSILGTVTALQITLFKTLNFDSNVGGLTSREKERLKMRLVSLRRHVGQKVLVCLLCIFTVIVLTTYDLPRSDWRFAGAAGFIIAVGILYLLGAVSANYEIADFVDEVKCRDSIEKRRAEVVKSMS